MRLTSQCLLTRKKLLNQKENRTLGVLDTLTNRRVVVAPTTFGSRSKDRVDNIYSPIHYPSEVKVEVTRMGVPNKKEEKMVIKIFRRGEGQ